MEIINPDGLLSEDDLKYVKKCVDDTADFFNKMLQNRSKNSSLTINSLDIVAGCSLAVLANLIVMTVGEELDGDICEHLNGMLKRNLVLSRAHREKVKDDN